MMVALRELYPTDPEDRASVEDVFQRHPDARRFIKRLQEHVHSTFDNPDITLSTRQYDEWDPPLSVFIDADFPLSEYKERLLALLGWMRTDPDYDLNTVAVLLHRKPVNAPPR